MVYVALPCLQFSSRERAIIKEVDKCILTFPEFHDNYFVRYKRFKQQNWRKLFIISISRHAEHVVFAVYPDMQKDMTYLLKKYDHINWIYPLHYMNELDFVLKHEFTWIGMPHRTKWRDYSVQWFVEITGKYGLKKWYLGWWNESNPSWLKEFNGFDTTLPEYYAYRGGKIWIRPLKAKKAENMKAIDIFRTNVVNFRNWVEKYLGTIECPR